MSDNHAADWNNYWQGRSANTTGNSLLGVGIENNEVLTEFWQTVFADIDKSSQLVDFACGAGSVLRQAKSAGFVNLTGLDISEKAIDVLQAKIAEVSGHIAPVNDTKFDDASFDVVVSQFGFEYAGDESNILAASREMSRVLRDKGEIILVSHIEGGAIASECFKSLEQIERILKSDFINRAKIAFRGLYKAQKSPTQKNKDAMSHSIGQMNASARPILDALQASGDTQNDFTKFTHHLMKSTEQLFNRYQRYDVSDCLTWLDSMMAEIKAYEGRMSSMTLAALSEASVAAILNEFAKSGLRVDTPQKLHFVEGHMPAAWVLRAYKT